MKNTKYSAKALIVSKYDSQLVLIVKERLSNGKIVYDLPGGGIENGETHHGALNRELDEELSIKVEIGEKLGEYWFNNNLTHTKVICHTFLCKFDPKIKIDLDSNPAENEEIIETKWLKVEEVLNSNLPGIVPSLKKLFKKIKLI